MTSIRADGMVEFRFFRRDAGQVAIAGDFNDWQVDSLSMRTDGQGWWVAEVKLPRGEYRFRYVADGRWFTDYASHGVEREKHGWNSVLVVGEEQTPVVRRGTGLGEGSYDPRRFAA